MNVLRASAFNTSSSPVGSLASSMPQRVSTKQAPIPMHVKRFLVRHRRPVRIRAQRAKGKAKFLFFHSKRQYLVHSLPRQLDCRLDLFSLLRRTKSAAANQSICGVSPQGGEIASRYCIIFFRSFAREIACSSRKGHTLPKIYWTYCSYNDLADRPSRIRTERANIHTKLWSRMRATPRMRFFSSLLFVCVCARRPERLRVYCY